MRQRVGLAVLTALLVFLFGCRSDQAQIEDLEIVCLDVGQGASLLVRTPQEAVLVDAGSESTQEQLCARLRALGVLKLNCLILTHSDEDHIGGADAVIREFDVSEIWVSAVWEANEAALRLWHAAREKALIPIEASVGAKRTFGKAVLTVLAPLSDRNDENEGSLALMLRHGDFSMLLMGDTGVETEAEMLRTYGEVQLRADWLLAAHHGSNSSCSAEFLQAVQPKAALISCGAGNAYGHPDGRVLFRLDAVGAEIYRTDRQGEIRIAVNAEGYRVFTALTE